MQKKCLLQCANRRPRSFYSLLNFSTNLKLDLNLHYWSHEMQWVSSAKLFLIQPFLKPKFDLLTVQSISWQSRLSLNVKEVIIIVGQLSPAQFLLFTNLELVLNLYNLITSLLWHHTTHAYRFLIVPFYSTDLCLFYVL